MEKRTIIVIILCIATIAIFVILINVLQRNQSVRQDTAQNRVPTPTSVFVGTDRTAEVTPSLIPAQSSEYKQSLTAIYKSENQVVKREEAVGKLLNLVPHQGTDFVIDFNFDTSQYVVTIQAAKRQEGDVAFDAFLRQNGIESRNWFRKGLLLIQYP